MSRENCPGTQGDFLGEFIGNIVMLAAVKYFLLPVVKER
jgi:hypothetical protein